MEELPREELRSKGADMAPDAASLREGLRQQQHVIRSLQSRIAELEAEIRGMHSSLSWRITKPLRYLARRLIHSLPGVNALVHRALGSAQDSLVTALPKSIAQPLLGNDWQVGESIEEQIARYRSSRSAGQRKIVLYTAIFGEYDNLLLPSRIDLDIDYVCFTDRPRNNYGVWQLRSSPFHHPDPTRVARYVKTHPHDLFPEHDVAIWVDANIIFKGDARAYIDRVMTGGGDLGLIPHPHRGCFYEEAEACKRLRKETPAMIDLQVEHYRKHGLPTNQELFETGFMVVPLQERRTTEAFECWWQQIERFTRRDQLGLAWMIYQFPDLKIVPLLPRGASVRNHDDYRYFRHKFAQSLTIPDELLRLGTVVTPVGSDEPPQ